MTSRLAVLYLDQHTVNIGGLYRSTGGETTWIAAKNFSYRRNRISNVYRDLHTFEFEFSGYAGGFGRNTR